MRYGLVFFLHEYQWFRFLLGGAPLGLPLIDDFLRIHTNVARRETTLVDWVYEEWILTTDLHAKQSWPTQDGHLLEALVQSDKGAQFTYEVLLARRATHGSGFS